MRRLIPILLAALMMFSGCSKKDAVIYDLIVCDSELTAISEYMNSFSGENCKVENIQFIQEQIDSLFASVEENDDTVNSITIYSKNLSAEQAVQFVDWAKEINIPVIFSFADISDDILESYDKAYAVKTDYVHAAEITAEKITDFWKDDIIIDQDKNLIFKFAVVKDETLTADKQTFLDTLIYCMELYGIPMQLSETVDSAEITSAEDIEAIKDINEGIIVISDNVFPLLADYSAEGDGVEIVTISHNSENVYSGDFSIINCLIDYSKYSSAVNQIIENYNQRNYLLENISFPYINKTIYIPATV